MSRKVLILTAGGLVAVITWFALAKYRPSTDGLTEEGVALSDMIRYCQVAKLDCGGLRVQERIAPVQGTDAVHWEFVVQLGDNGARYVIAVTPGVESQVTPLEPRRVTPKHE